MLLIPAIDPKEGRCVRLKQGLMEQATVFFDSPAETALYQLKRGACRLRLMDLSGTFVGTSKNLPAIRSILAEITNDIPVQLGGGIRDLATVEEYLNLGLADVIIGTVAVKNPDFIREACKGFPGQIIVGLDTKDGMVAIDGRVTVTKHRVADLVKRPKEDGVNAITYTDIGHSDMMSGINIETTAELTQAAAAPVIASNGPANLDDIRALCATEKHGVAGAIIGRAVYEGNIDFVEAQRLADALSAA